MNESIQKMPITALALKEVLAYGHGNLYGFQSSYVSGDDIDDIIIDGYEITVAIKEGFCSSKFFKTFGF